MAKVSTEDADDVLYAGNWLTVRAITRRNGSRPAKEWANGLDNKGVGQLLAACRVIETTLSANRAPSGRLEKIRGVSIGGTKIDLLELRVTPKGATPPHHRLIVVRSGKTLWATHGFTKQKNKLPNSAITTAESILHEWQGA